MVPRMVILVTGQLGEFIRGANSTWAFGSRIRKGLFHLCLSHLCHVLYGILLRIFPHWVMRSHDCYSQCLCYQCSIQEDVFCAKAPKVIPYFLISQVQCVWFHAEVFDSVDLEFCAEQKHGSIIILLLADIQLDQHRLLKMLIFFYWVFLESLYKIRCPQLC